MFPWRFSFYLFLSITVSVVAADPLGFADARIEQGKEYLVTGRLQEAEALLAKIIESDPNHSEAHHLLGLSYLQEGRFREAERHLDRAAQLNPTSAESFQKHRNELACVLVEPIPGNMGCVPPEPGYLSRLRELTREQGTLLIFDEVITGFRVAYGGAQELYGIQPDLTALGKIIGGGLPVGAFGGAAKIMEQLAPLGPVYQAGTLSGNPLAVAAGMKTLEILHRPGTYERLEQLGASLAEGMQQEASRAGVKWIGNRVGSMLTGFFTADPVRDYASAKRSDPEAFARYFRSMLSRGVYLAPSQFELAFVSLAHGEPEIQQTLEAARAAFGELAA